MPTGTYPQARVATAQDRVGAIAFLEGLATELSEGSVDLPCFPDVVIRIRKALDDPDTPLTETVKLVGAEPRLAAQLLQTANSAAFNLSGKPVTELPTAITRLGHRLVQSSAMAFAVQQMQLAPVLSSIAKPLKALWETSITVASHCHLIAQRTAISPDEAFLTGLLCGIGRLYLMVRAAGAADRLGLDNSLLDMIESWHPSIGKAVLENWGFPEAMTAAVGNQQDHDYGPRGPVDHADILIVSLVLSDGDMSHIKSFSRLALTPEDCRSILERTQRQIGELHAALGC